MDKSKRAIAPKSNHSFSLGLDSETLTKLKELQNDPVLTLKGERKPSRTLITRAAIQFYGLAVSQAKFSNRQEWLRSQNEHMEYLAFCGPKYGPF